MDSVELRFTTCVALGTALNLLDLCFFTFERRIIIAKKLINIKDRK